MLRVEKVWKEMEKLKLGAFLTDDPYHIFYLTGFSCSTGRLLITEKDIHLLLDGRYTEEARGIVSCSVIETKELDTAWKKLISSSTLVGFNDQKTTVERAEKWKGSHKNLKSTQDPISKVRQVKEPQEVVLMKQAASLSLAAVEEVKKLLKPGISEKDLVSQLEVFWLQQGGFHPSFEPIILFGERSCFPHGKPSDRNWKVDEIVQIDLGVCREKYQSDLSRVFYAESSELKEIYSIVSEAQQAAFDLIRPGVSFHSIDQAARSVIERRGYTSFFPHSLGHGIGLEIHEPPWIRQKLSEDQLIEEGMCFTIEPGIYLPGKGGVRLEETIVVTKDGWEGITR